MRLHSLSLHAVGPFADRQEVDFDRLGAGGLFLFEGPTGVGKTTILDAVTFALYGGLASDASDVSRMRSDHADPGTRPEVVLEFSVRGHRYRVTRSPEHRRPKRRGSGHTTEKASVHLERSTGSQSWETLSHSKEEVAGLVGELLGLNRAQFRQVVLLPQGEFATFLRADDDQRREVLVKLFGTHFYGRVTDELQARAQAARATLVGADSELSARFAAACEAAGVAGSDLLGDGEIPLGMRERVEAVRGLAGPLAEAAAVAEAVVEVRDADVARARARLDDATGVLERVQRRVAVAARLAELEAGRVEHEARVAKVAAARRAAPLRPLLLLLVESQVRVTTAEAAAEKAGCVGPGHREDLGADSIARLAGRARADAAGLAHSAEDEGRLIDLRASLALAVRDVVAARAEHDAVVSRAEGLPAEVASRRRQWEGARAAAVQAATLEVRIDALRTRIDEAVHVEQLRRKVGESRGVLRAARQAFELARDEVELLTEHRLGDLRAELAERLVSGDPCLVCGSREHPAPADARGTGVTEQQVRDAVARRDQAQVEREAAELVVVRAEAALEAARTQVGQATEGDLTSELATLSEQRDQMAAQAAGESRLAEEVEDLAAQSEHLSAARVEAVRTLATAVARRDALQSDLSRTEQAVAVARGEFPTVHDRIAALNAHADELERAAEAVAQLRAAVAERDRVAGLVDREAADAGFRDSEEAGSALVADDGLQRWEEEVDRWVAEVHSATVALGSPELAAVADVSPVVAQREVQGAQEVLATSADQAAHARRQAAVAVERRDRFTGRLAELEVCLADREELAARAEEVIALDQYARGMAGTPRMGLVTFVLRYWFEQVVDAANVRLAEMSAGKYQLVRVDEGARRDARVGLGLAVLDRHTGLERSPATLSGGETFYTSLSLALGLADVVVAQAGGAQLDTLFIDEGFGSLDPDTLDDVMGVIDDLRGNGRVVGIVSHVPDLKERIPERLQVRRARPDGPSTVTVLA